MYNTKLYLNTCHYNSTFIFVPGSSSEERRLEKYQVICLDAVTFQFVCRNYFCQYTVDRLMKVFKNIIFKLKSVGSWGNNIIRKQSEGAVC